MQLRTDSTNAKASGEEVIVEQTSGTGSSDEQCCSYSDSDQALLSNRQGAERKQEAAQRVPAVATAEHSKQSCLSGLVSTIKKMKRKSSASAESAALSSAAVVTTAAGEVAAAGASPPDSKPHSSGKRKPLQKLKKLLPRRLRPNCMHAAHTCTHSHQQEPTVLKDNSRKGSRRLSKCSFL